MSGIPVYNQSPINASKASGVTPQTAAPVVQNTPNTPSTTTASSTTSYPPARPGAAPPAPTGTAAQRYAPAPTPTTTLAPEGPPAPQPGAAPTPHKSTIPPPPKAGEKYQYHAPQVSEPPVAQPQPYPHQMAIPPPTGAYGAQPPSSSTSTTYNPSSSYPVPIASQFDGAPRRSLEHPQGYHQNVYASEPSSDQRRAQEAAVNNSRHHHVGDIGADEGDSIWNQAKKLALQAGEAVAKAEAEVWKRVNKD